MSKFTSPASYQTIDCKDGDWVKIPSQISYADAEVFMATDSKVSEHERILTLLQKFIKEWNFKDDNGNVVPVDRDWLMKVNLETVFLIINGIFKNLPDTLKVRAKVAARQMGVEIDDKGELIDGVNNEEELKKKDNEM